MDRRQFHRCAAAALAAWACAPTRAAPPPVDETWSDPGRGRELPLRVRWPSGDVPCAVVLFSHGLGGDRTGGAVWAEAWQAAGVAVLHLQHPGSDRSVWRDGLRGVRRGAEPQQYLERVRDAHFVLDELQRLQAADPRWRRIRTDAIGFCGHSFGARLTQALAGERLPRAAPEAAALLQDRRPRAFIAFSPGLSSRDAGSAAAIARRFGAVDRPFLCITGSQDGAMIAGDADQPSRRAVYGGLPGGAKAELVLDGADHMTFAGQADLARSGAAGWLLRREPGAAAAQARHHAVVAAITTDWWRWRLLADDDAADRLRQPHGLGPADVWQQG